MILWKAWKARHPIPSPWRAIIKEYAGRVLCQPGGDSRLSQQGSPPPKPPSNESWRRWLYYDTVKLLADLPGEALSAEETKAVPPGASTSIFDLSTLPVQAVSPEAPGAERQLERAGELRSMSHVVPRLAPVLDEARATEIATTLFEAYQELRAIYWRGTGPTEGTFDLEILIPALRRVSEEGKGWSGSKEFLLAAERGEARQFIETRRRWAIANISNKLLKGDAEELRRARKAGFEV